MSVHGPPRGPGTKVPVWGPKGRPRCVGQTARDAEQVKVRGHLAGPSPPSPHTTRQAHAGCKTVDRSSARHPATWAPPGRPRPTATDRSLGHQGPQDASGSAACGAVSSLYVSHE